MIKDICLSPYFCLQGIFASLNDIANSMFFIMKLAIHSFTWGSTVFLPNKNTWMNLYFTFLSFSSLLLFFLSLSLPFSLFLFIFIVCQPYTGPIIFQIAGFQYCKDCLQFLNAIHFCIQLRVLVIICIR